MRAQAVASLLKRPIVVHLLVLFVVLGALLSEIGTSGVWDPYELDNAELARRIEVHLFEDKADPSHVALFPAPSHSLALASDPKTIPTTSDLGMGELPFTSMAMAYRVYGWHDWSGRLAMALWSFAGAMALYVFLVRLVDRRTGVFGVITLLSMPLFFMQARTMLCDAVPIAAFSIATAGFALFLGEDAWFDKGVALTVGLIGLLAGYMSRGLLLGVGAPLVAVGGAGFLAPRARFRPFTSAVSISMLAVGIGATVEWLRIALPLSRDPTASVRRVVGMTLYDPTPRDSTFDRTFRQVGHALFPWSAFLPFAIGRVAQAPSGDAKDGEVLARFVVIVGAGAALLASTTVVPYAGTITYAGVSMLAAATAIALRDFERDGSNSRVVALGTVILGAILYYDAKREPIRMLETFTVEGVTFPASFAHDSEARLLVVAALFFGVAALAFMDPPKVTEPFVWKETYFDAARWWKEKRAEFANVGGALGDAWNGNLLFVFVILEAFLIGVAALLFLGTRGAHLLSKETWESISKLSRSNVALGMNLWWKLPLGIAAAAVGFTLARDALDAALRALRSNRATAVMCAGAVAGALLSFGYYPALASQLSPKRMFQTFREERGPNDELGLLGVSARSASFYWNGDVHAMSEPSDAYAWLDDAPPGTARWLVLHARDLPKLNASHRAAYRSNLPILDASSSQILLASSSLGGRSNQNPFDDAILDRVPPIAHAVDARFSDEVDALGWDIASEDGKPVASVITGETYTMHFYYRVQRPVPGNWQAFVHVDGKDLRHNADHAVLDGKYPMNLWREGDIVKDTTTLELEPNFTPGEYAVYYGFYNSSARMKVTNGTANEDRVYGGSLVVH